MRDGQLIHTWDQSRQDNNLAVQQLTRLHRLGPLERVLAQTP